MNEDIETGFRNGTWVVLHWEKKPKQLGTGFFWQCVTKPLAHSVATLKAAGFKGKTKVWPVTRFSGLQR